MTIPALINTDTFQQWFETTNTIISEINGITIHNLIPGDGISLTSNGNNVYTIKHGTSVATPVTFTGPVSFTNTVSFSTAPSVSSVTVSVSPIISGITIGNVVRITDTGLTLSKADSKQNAEILGIVTGVESGAHTVSAAGNISNTTFANTIANLIGIAGATLTPGTVYFLSPSVAGGITTIEPTTYQHVSKPILLGFTGSSGLILPYRGAEIEGISAGITAELDNKAIIQIDYSTARNGVEANTTGVAIKSGDPVCVFDENIMDNEFLSLLLLNLPTYTYNTAFKRLGNINGSSTNNAVIVNSNAFMESGFDSIRFSDFIYGLVSKVILDDTVNKVCIVEIVLPGGSFNVKISDLDTTIYTQTNKTTGYWWDNATSTWTTNAGLDKTNTFLKFIKNNDAENTAKIIFTNNIKYDAVTNTSNFIGLGTTVSGITGALEYDNLIPNGSFTIWQRTFNNLSGVTAAGLSGYATPIADRWFYVAASTTDNPGLTVNIEKQAFDAGDITIPGSPYYWVDLKQTYTSATDLNYRPRLENIQRGARLLQGQEATVTFWAKSTTTGATLDVIYNRYIEGSYGSIPSIENELAARETVVSGVTLSSTWSRYAYTFTTTAQSAVSGTNKGWYGLGFEFPSAGVTLSIAQVKLELGTDIADYVHSTPEQELERCSPYYLRTYDWNQTTGYSGTSKLNEQYLQLGNLLTQKNYTIKFPVEMVQTPNTVTLYSPTGEKDEAYNINKNIDMRYPRCEGCPIHVNLPWDTSTVRTSLPSGNITVSDKSINGMQVTINNGATHFDGLKFHYVVDADIKFTI